MGLTNITLLGLLGTEVQNPAKEALDQHTGTVHAHARPLYTRTLSDFNLNRRSFGPGGDMRKGGFFYSEGATVGSSGGATSPSLEVGEYEVQPWADCGLAKHKFSPLSSPPTYTPTPTH